MAKGGCGASEENHHAEVLINWNKISVNVKMYELECENLNFLDRKSQYILMKKAKSSLCSKPLSISGSGGTVSRILSLITRGI